MSRRCQVLAFSLLILAPLTAAGQEWTRFRGPNGSGVAEKGDFPVAWSEKDYKWRTELPDTGHSSPVVWGDKLFVTATVEGDGTRIVRCLATADGQSVWQQRLPASTYKQNKFNSYAASTPAVDADRLYTTWATPEQYLVLALSQADGREVWRRDLGPFLAEHGFGASPIRVGDLLIVANDQDGTSFVIGLDAATGETRWKTDRTSKKAAYSTPCLFRGPDGADQLILTCWAHGITSLDPLTGRENWELRLFDKRVVGSPLAAEGLIFASSGEGGGGKKMVAVRPGKPGDKAELAYEITGSLPYVPTPVARGRLVFLWNDGGVVTCLDAPTGRRVWQERVGGKYFGSPICVGDRVYCMSREGEMVILAASEQYKLLGRVPLGEPSNATPAVAGGVMYLRTLSHVMALGSRGG